MSRGRPEKLIITSGCDELGDFIPLSPLHQSDTEDTRVPFSDVGSFQNSQMESDTLDAYEYMNRPYFPCLPKLTNESFRKENMDNRECSDADDSNQSSLCTKSLCSDIASKRTSVFFRLGGVASERLPLKKEESEDCASKKRKSVFLRLSGVSEEGINDDDEEANQAKKEKAQIQSIDLRRRHGK